jgi:hypothetical protein
MLSGRHSLRHRVGSRCEVGHSSGPTRHIWHTLLFESGGMSAATICQKTSLVTARLLLTLSCFSLAGCVTDSTASLRDAHAEVPKPSSNSVYPPLEDMSSNHKAPALTLDEQSKLKQDLAATRDRQATAAKTQNDSK